jgi:methylenetetrahydrofolate dehydrogenase (NADP+)/methenyltetrahydrofolate cyclohydrolase
MMAGRIIDGKSIADSILRKVRKEVVQLKKKGVVPKLVVIQVGNDPASTIYVNLKHRTCLELGMASEVERFPTSITYEEILREIRKLNADRSVHGILVQLPLPEHLNHKKVLETVDPAKDVDGLHPYNQGKNLLGKECFRPATPRGIVTLLESTGIELEGKSAVVIGRSNIVGKPLAVMLLNKGCTVTVCHSKTKKLSEFTRRADILVSAVGKAGLVTAPMVKKGAVVIDVGMNRSTDGKLVGDVDFKNVIRKASWITPVPKGVGPMTIASLMENTIKACRDIEWPRQ